MGYTDEMLCTKSHEYLNDHEWLEYNFTSCLTELYCWWGDAVGINRSPCISHLKTCKRSDLITSKPDKVSWFFESFKFVESNSC